MAGGGWAAGGYWVGGGYWAGGGYWTGAYCCVGGGPGGTGCPFDGACHGPYGSTGGAGGGLAAAS